jgi:hypothetical protein
MVDGTPFEGPSTIPVAFLDVPARQFLSTSYPSLKV